MWCSVRAAGAKRPALPDSKAYILCTPLFSIIIRHLLSETPDWKACESCGSRLRATFIDQISIITPLSHFFDDMPFVSFPFYSLLIQQMVLEHLLLVRRQWNDKSPPWSVWRSQAGVDESQSLGNVSALGTRGSILPSSSVRDAMMPSSPRGQ